MTTNWTGNVDGDLENASNWSNGIPASGDTAAFDYAYLTGNAANPSSGTCAAGTVTNIGISIDGGTWSGAIDTWGYINAGTFNGTVATGSAIGDGTFNGAVTSTAPEGIAGGTYYDTVTFTGAVYGGTYYGTITNIVTGFIADGTFYGAVTTDTSIEGGTYYGPVTNNGVIRNFGTITFYGTVTDNGTIDNANAGSIIFAGVYINTAGIFDLSVDWSNLKGLKVDNSPTFTLEKGINGSGILSLP